ncbi:hypothetical protein [Streptomyces sp. NBC_01794]|uniref:hypothetical protein n=1 Tax=Streptomyces sp. NBC_01794 TaxID=2975942 RepID=UPI003093BE63|nr:hypothetical protein OIE54_00055 [Streptomyces sp. NBC_01794]WSB05212.1 hypothetical protein OIE54_42095 [Streptomyces sp. NBC_01794]
MYVTTTAARATRRALYEGIKHSEKELHFIAGVDHYIRGRPEGLIETRDLCSKWPEAHDLR